MSCCGCEGAPAACILLLPSAPQETPRHLAAGRYGDFGGFRGETRNPSKAGNEGSSPRVLLHSNGSALDSCDSALIVNKSEEKTNTKRSVKAGLFVTGERVGGCRYSQQSKKQTWNGGYVSGIVENNVHTNVYTIYNFNNFAFTSSSDPSSSSAFWKAARASFFLSAAAAAVP